MSSQTLKLNFNDLKNLSSVEIVEAISPDTAIEVSLKSIKTGEVSGQEIYKTWATSLFKSYGPVGIIDTDLDRLFDLFSLAIQELLNECGDCQSDEQIEKLYEFLNYSLELFGWIKSTAKDFDTQKITEFLCFGLSSINNYLTALSKQTNRINTRKLIEKSLAIHTLIMGILTEYPKMFCFNTNHQLLRNLIVGLCGVGEITPKLDIKTAVETWKCITRLASQNAGQSTNNHSEDFFWLTRPMSFLVNEIGRNVQTVYSQNCLSEPIQQIQKYLKVTNFYLRLLQKLCNDFHQIPFLICEEFIATLALVFNPPVYIANTPVYKVIMEYLGKDLKEVMPFAYRNHVFFEKLVSEHSANVYTKEAIHEIVLQSIDVIIQKDEFKYLNEQSLDQALKIITESYINGPPAKYNRCVEVLSCLQIRCNEERLEKKFVCCILNDSTIQALAVIDVWCTTFRLLDHSTRLTYLKFWTDINERFAKFSNTMPAFHTELLLNNLYNLLSSQEKIDFWNKFNACTLKNERFLLAIGLDAIPKNCAVKQSIIQHFLNELLRLQKQSNSDMSVQSYYTIITDLKLLKPIDFQNDEIIVILLQHLEIAIQNKKLHLLVESILDFIAPRIGVIDGNMLQEVLSSIKFNISLFDEYSTKICFINFLKSVAKLSRFEKQCKETLKLLECDKEIKHFGYLEETTLTDSVDAEECDKIWKKIVENRNVVESPTSHVCCTATEKNDKPQNKDIEIILESLENDAYKLQKLAQCRRLSICNLETIKRVVAKMQSLSKMNV